MKTYFIAEIGVNHNGKINNAYKMIDEAVKAGASAIKMQIYKSSELVTGGHQKAHYQKLYHSNDTQLKMLKKYELSESDHLKIYKYSKKKRIDYIATAFDTISLNFLIKKIKPKYIKVASGDITDGPLLLQISRSKCKIILSTGMSNLHDVRDALKIISFGLLCGKTAIPSKKKLNESYNKMINSLILKKKVILMHCTSQYPTPLKDVNLLALKSMRKTFKLEVGYSDHTKSNLTAIAALAMNARYIEKHFTLNNNLIGPDHKSSLNLKELKNLITVLKNTESLLGNDNKEPTKIEVKNIHYARKIIVASQEIKKGEKFSLDNLTRKRAGNGISPMKIWSLVGKKSKKNYKYEMIIDEK